MILPFCAVCARKGDLHKHHFVPRSLGGEDDQTNILTLCSTCHNIIHSTSNLSSCRSATKRALARKKERGEKLGGDVPFGYALAEDGVTLEEDNDEQQTILLIKHMVVHDMASFRGIASILNSEGRPTKRGCLWSGTQVSRIARRFRATGKT